MPGQVQVIQSHRPRISDAIGTLASTLQGQQDTERARSDSQAKTKAGALMQFAINKNASPEQWNMMRQHLASTDPSAAQLIPDIASLPPSEYEKAKQKLDMTKVGIQQTAADKMVGGSAGATDPTMVFNPDEVGREPFRQQQLYDVLKGGTGASPEQAQAAGAELKTRPTADVALREQTEGPLRVAQAGEATARGTQLIPAQAKEATARATQEIPAAAAEKRAQAGKETAEAANVGKTGLAPEIKVNTPEWRTAQAMAYGGLTFSQFRTLFAYSRDAKTKVAIYDLAQQLNPKFDAAAFELGYKFAANPKIRQQISSADNAIAMIPEAIDISDKATRLGPNALNKLVVGGGVALGGRKYTDAQVMQKAFADEVSGALGFGSATDMTRELGLSMSDLSMSSPNFRSAMAIVGDFLQKKRGTLVNQMGVYGKDVNSFSKGEAATTMPQNSGPSPADQKFIDQATKITNPATGKPYTADEAAAELQRRKGGA